MLNIEECTHIWSLIPEASMEKFEGEYMVVNYSTLISRKEIESDMLTLEKAGYIAKPHGSGLKIRKAA